MRPPVLGHRLLCLPWVCAPVSTSPAALLGSDPPLGSLADPGHGVMLKTQSQGPRRLGSRTERRCSVLLGKAHSGPSQGSRGKVAKQGCELASVQELKGLSSLPTAPPPVARMLTGSCLAQARFPHLPNVPNTECHTRMGGGAEDRSRWAWPSRCCQGTQGPTHPALLHVMSTRTPG